MFLGNSNKVTLMCSQEINSRKGGIRGLVITEGKRWKKGNNKGEAEGRGKKDDASEGDAVEKGEEEQANQGQNKWWKRKRRHRKSECECGVNDYVEGLADG